MGTSSAGLKGLIAQFILCSLSCEGKSLCNLVVACARYLGGMFMIRGNRQASPKSYEGWVT